MSKMYKVWWPDRGQDPDDALRVKAFDAEDAAKKWADWYDYHSNDYAIVGGESADVMVLGDDEFVPAIITVHGEMTRSYRASQMPAAASTSQEKEGAKGS
jgi:hypothetical protein